MTRFRAVGSGRHGVMWWLLIGATYYLTVGWLVEPLRW